MEIPVHEVVPKCRTRTDLGRVVINPPKVTGPLKLRQECRFRMCCNRAFLTEESFKKHLDETTEHGKPLDFSRFPKPVEAPPQPEKQSSSSSKISMSDQSSREFWIYKKEGVADKVFEVTDKPEPTLNSNGHDKGGLQRVTVMDVDYTGNGRRWKKCDICNLNTDSMTRHLKTCHASGPHKCQYCPCTFNSDKSRSLHQRRMHKVISSTVSRKLNIVARAKKHLVSTKLSKDIESQLRKGKVPQCPVCQKVFSNMTHAREHLSSHYGIKLHKCDKCAASFSYSSSLRRHMNTAHSSTPRFFCNVCKRGFSSYQSFGFHRRSVHLQGPGGKPNGKDSNKLRNGLQSQDLSYLTLQQPTRNTEGMYDCHICNKKLTTPQTLRGHMLIHQNLKPYKCKLCGVSFRLSGTRSTHIKNCHTNGPFKCKDCTCSFNFQRPMDRHRQIYHSTAKSESNVKMEVNSFHSMPVKRKSISNSTFDSEVTGFKCEMCGIITNRLVDFNKHKLLHSSNVERNTCNLCLKKFGSANNIPMHKKRAHGDGSQKCSFCCCQYHSTASLFQHLTKEHGMERREWDFKKRCIKPEAIKRIQVYFYDSSMNKSDNLFPLEETTTGRTIEDLKTDKISNSFPQSIDLSITGKRMIKCDLCNLKVSFRALRQHQRKSHYHDGKHQCSQCPCKFKMPHGLRVHRTAHHGHIGKRRTKAERLTGADLNSENYDQVQEQNTQESEHALSYLCTICEETFQDTLSFSKHMEVHQSGIAKQFECDLCHMRFAHRSSIRNHKRKSHFHNGLFKCSICPCKFLSMGGLVNHKKVHHGYVGARPRSRKPLAKYSRIKFGIKSTLGVKQKPGFKKHNSFQCSLCAKVLSSQTSLDLHFATHTRKGTEKYECDLCNLKFLHPGSISLHKKRSHNHNGKYNCSKCSCKFWTLGGLSNHEAKFHELRGRRKKCMLDAGNAAAAVNSDDIARDADLPNEQSAKRVDNPTDTTTVECQMCLLQIHFRTKMAQHLQNCHFHDGTFQCSLCTCKFKSLYGISRHKLKYHENKMEPQGKKSGKEKSTAFNKSVGAPGRIIKPSTKVVNSTFAQALKVLKKTKQRDASSRALSTCGVCGCNFSRKAVLIKHMKVAHSNGAYKCKYCNCCFHNAVGLSAHVTWHETGRTFVKRNSEEDISEVLRNNDGIQEQAKTIKNRATGRYNLNFLKIRGSYASRRSNIINKPSTKTAESQQEGLSATSEALYPPKHQQSQVKYRLYCDLCGIKFSQQIYLERHSKKAHVVGGINCSKCSCTFASSVALGAHKRVYHNVSRHGSFKVRKRKSVTGLSPGLCSSPLKRHKHNDSIDPLLMVNGDTTQEHISAETLPNVTLEISNEASGLNTSIERAKVCDFSSLEKLLSNEQQPKPQFQCSWCGKSFAQQKYLNNHLLCHTRPEPCPKCNLRFRRREEVVKHVKMHHGNGQFQCRSCSCRFTTEQGAKIHFSAVHNKLTVGTSNNDFVIEHQLQEDYEYGDDESFIQVDSTYSQSADSSEFCEESEPIVQGILDTNYSSNFINQRVEYEHEVPSPSSSSSYLQLALQVDLRKDGVRCDKSDSVVQSAVNGESTSESICQSPSNVSKRTLIPKKAKAFPPKSRPITCGICDVTCYGPENLRLHMESHIMLHENEEDQNQGELIEGNNNVERRNFKCDTCGNEFSSEEELQQHYENEHDETGLYRCAYCPCTMKTETNLRYHFTKYHEL